MVVVLWGRRRRGGERSVCEVGQPDLVFPRKRFFSRLGAPFPPPAGHSDRPRLHHKPLHAQSSPHAGREGAAPAERQVGPCASLHNKTGTHSSDARRPAHRPSHGANDIAHNHITSARGGEGRREAGTGWAGEQNQPTRTRCAPPPPPRPNSPCLHPPPPALDRVPRRWVLRPAHVAVGGDAAQAARAGSGRRVRVAAPGRPVFTVVREGGVGHGCVCVCVGCHPAGERERVEKRGEVCFVFL